MPPSTSTRGRTLRAVLALFILAISCGIYGFLHLGFFLSTEDSLQQADAIFVLSGSRIARPLEGADLYLAGYASNLVLTRDSGVDGIPSLVARGIPFVDDVTRVHGLLLQLGIPSEAILIPERVHGSTAEEAITLRELATREEWRRVIIVSSKYHLKRAGFAFRRELRETDIQVLMRSTRYEDFDPAQWWQHRSDIREIVRELPKLLAYGLGFGA